MTSKYLPTIPLRYVCGGNVVKIINFPDYVYNAGFPNEKVRTNEPIASINLSSPRICPGDLRSQTSILTHF